MFRNVIVKYSENARQEYLGEALHVLRECAHAPPSEVLQQLQDGRVHRVVRGHRPEEIRVLLLIRKNRRGGGEGKLRKRERTAFFYRGPAPSPSWQAFLAWGKVFRLIMCIACVFVCVCGCSA